MKRGIARCPAMQEASAHGRQKAILEYSGKHLSFRIGLIHLKLLPLTYSFWEFAKSGASARELFALLLEADPPLDPTPQKLLLLL